MLNLGFDLPDFISPLMKQWLIEYKLNQIFHLHLTALSYQPWHPRYNCFAKATHWRQDLMEVWWDYANIVRQMRKNG